MATNHGNRLSWFARFAKTTSSAAGHPVTFLAAVLTIALWGVTGPIFQFSDTWQLVINTATTIVTFLMVFLIQNTQNRESAAIQVKLDELIRSVEGAQNHLIGLEEMGDGHLEHIKKSHKQIAREAEAEGAQTTQPPARAAPRHAGETSFTL